MSHATREEVAAIMGVTVALEHQRAVVFEERADELHMWVAMSRRSAQRAGLQRGPWRMSGRLGRRNRV